MFSCKTQEISFLSVIQINKWWTQMKHTHTSPLFVVCTTFLMYASNLALDQAKWNANAPWSCSRTPEKYKRKHINGLVCGIVNMRFTNVTYEKCLTVVPPTSNALSFLFCLVLASFIFPWNIANLEEIGLIQVHYRIEKNRIEWNWNTIE